MKKVSIIIVNWNGLHHLKKCLPSLKKINYPNYEIILVDNGSTDESIDYIKSKFSEIKVVKNKKNLGFAGGNNSGLRLVLGEYVLLLNNDTLVKKNFLTKLVTKIEQSDDTGIVQSKILSMDDNRKLDSVGAFFTNTGFLYHHGYLQSDAQKFDKTKYLYTAKGACMLIRKKLINKIGLFDDQFFAYFEETDFCHRAWLAGYKVVYAPESIIYHKIGGTSNSMNNAFIQYHSFKNRITSYLKNLGTLELIKIIPLHIILCEIAALTFLIKLNAKLFLSINKAIFYNIQNLNSILKQRRIIQNKLRKKSDNQLFSILKVNPELKYYLYLFSNNLQNYKSKITISNAKN